MTRITAAILGAIILGAEGGMPAVGASSGSAFVDAWQQPAAQQPALDVATLLSTARGAPPIMCALAAQTVRNFGWGDWSAAPVTPLSSVAGRGVVMRREQLTSAEVSLLLESLASDDACVRELSVRLIGRDRRAEVTSGLLTRLASDNASLREVDRKSVV